jgi:hypothetical protein
MRSLSSDDFLNIWERGFRLHPLDRGLLALSAALPETSYDSLADWPLGQRNRALAELRCACFGPGLQGWIRCAQCEEKLEFQMDGRALMKQDVGCERNQGEPIVVNGHSFRLPTSRDLACAVREADSRLAAVRLLESCRLEEGVAPAWSEEEMEEVGEILALADPMAETRLTLHCPKCGYEWYETLDLATFLWSEIEARAKRLLMEIHSLASAYGWTEKEVLSLSEPRRAFYLEMVRG